MQTVFQNIGYKCLFPSELRSIKILGRNVWI